MIPILLSCLDAAASLSPALPILILVASISKTHGFVRSSLAYRRGWRSSSTAEKGEYMGSVHYLRKQPSRIDENHSLYDDFW